MQNNKPVRPGKSAGAPARHGSAFLAIVTRHIRCKEAGRFFYVARAALPFFFVLLASLPILMMFPEIALWLPNTMLDQ